VSRNRVSLALMIAGVGMMAGAVVLMLVAFGVILGGDGGNSSLETIAGFGEPIRTPTPGPTPTPADQFPPGSNAPVTRLIIEGAKIDAPVVVKGVDEQGVMQSPDNAYDTAWYNFSAHPGSPGNAVFAGHVDYIHVGKAVFWNLKDLRAGDLVQVRLADGTEYRYAVDSLWQYDSATAPVDQIVGPTPDQEVTLITCSGTFDSTTHQYDKRLVVRAKRLPEAIPSGTAGG
jgi:LPXTG-site transpeptidase (sortase) family protein